MISQSVLYTFHICLKEEETRLLIQHRCSVVINSNDKLDELNLD